MAASVALPLEKQFTSIAGVTSINSTSTQGGTDITIQFDINRNIDAAAQDVQSMIGRASRQLPPEMPSPPSYQKVNPADQSIFFIVLRSSTLSLAVLDEIAQSQVAQRISMVSGVAQVNIFGSQKFAVRVDVDPRELAARSIGIDEVASAINNANSNLPTGTIYGERTFVVRSNGQLMRASAYGPTIIAYRNGMPVRLDEVAHVYDGVENDKTASWQNGERCIYLPVQKQPGVNVVETVDRIKALAANHPRAVAGIGHARRPQRSRAHDSRVGARREAHTDDHGLAGRARDLHLPAQPLGDDHPEPGAAVLARRHLRGHVSARIQPRQSVAHGAHALGRLRRRRCDRDAGEHRPPHGDGEERHAGRLRCARRKWRSRFCR